MMIISLDGISSVASSEVKIMRVNKNIYVTFLEFFAFFYRFDPNHRTQTLAKVEKLLTLLVCKSRTNVLNVQTQNNIAASSRTSLLQYCVMTAPQIDRIAHT